MRRGKGQGRDGGQGQKQESADAGARMSGSNGRVLWRQGLWVEVGTRGLLHIVLLGGRILTFDFGRAGLQRLLEKGDMRAVEIHPWLPPC